MPYILPDLPYAPDAFGDILSADAFKYHHGKHHQAYVTKTNELIGADASLSGAALSEVIRAAREGGQTSLFNNAAQLWNHSFYWQCLSPDTQQPSGRLKDMIDQSFGSFDAMKTALHKEAVGHFASGWAWLVLDKGSLKILSLHDADTPAAHAMQPLLTIDVWEHAYYIDYHNARPDYVRNLLDRAINWEFVAQNLDGKGVSRADQ
ncbi:MAG: superoxide dismutase [Sphingomonadales bacterium]